MACDNPVGWASRRAPSRTHLPLPRHTFGAFDLGAAALAKAADGPPLLAGRRLEVVANEKVVLVHPALMRPRQQEPLMAKGAKAAAR